MWWTASGLPRASVSIGLARTPKVIAKRTQEDREQTLADLREMLASEEFRRYTEPLTREEVIERTERIRKQLREIATEERDYESLWIFHNNLRVKEWEPLDPQRRLLCRILQQIDLQALADIPQWERRVFSNMSGRYLLPLRVNLAPLLQQWQTERETFEKVLTSLHHQFTESDKEAMELFWWKAEIPDAQSPAEWRAPTKVYLEARRVGAESGFRFALYLADDEGRVLASTEYPPDAVWEGEEQWYKQQVQEDPTLAKLVEWREETRQWLQAWTILRSRGEVKPFPELLDPAKHEPLQFVATDVLRSYGRHRELALVALLDDWMLFWRWSDLSGEPQPLARVMTSRRWLQMSVTEGVLRVKPRLSSLHWDRRESREEMSRWIRRIVERGYITLEDAFDVAHHRLLAERYMLALVPGAHQFHARRLPPSSIPPETLGARGDRPPRRRTPTAPARACANTTQQLERISLQSPAHGGGSAGASVHQSGNGSRAACAFAARASARRSPARRAPALHYREHPWRAVGAVGVGVWGGFSSTRWLQRSSRNESESMPIFVRARAHPELPATACATRAAGAVGALLTCV
jgi:DNA-binding MarR family transcriptional regulator